MLYKQWFWTCENSNIQRQAYIGEPSCYVCVGRQCGNWPCFPLLPNISTISLPCSKIKFLFTKSYKIRKQSYFLLLHNNMTLIPTVLTIQRSYNHLIASFLPNLIDTSRVLTSNISSSKIRGQNCHHNNDPLALQVMITCYSSLFSTSTHSHVTPTYITHFSPIRPPIPLSPSSLAYQPASTHPLNLARNRGCEGHSHFGGLWRGYLIMRT